MIEIVTSNSKLFKSIYLSLPRHNKQQLDAYTAHMSRILKLQSTKPQAEFHALECKYPLFVGGFGSGKSETMFNQAIMDASHSSSALIALYAPTYDLVKLIIAARLVTKLEEHGISHKFNKSENVIYTSSPGFGDFILRTLDNPTRIVGYESYRAHVDELDTLDPSHAKEAWTKIIARNRQQPGGLEEPFNHVSAYSTPEGYSFVYERWVKSDSDMYQRVHAPTYSNPFIPDDYVDSLRATYPGELINAYIEGQFVNLVGGNVYSSFDRKICNSNEIIESDDVLYIGCDFNVTKQSAAVFVKRNSRYHAVDELVDMYDTPNMIEIIKNKWPTHKIIMYPDSTGGARKTVNASISDIALLEQAGFSVRAKKVNPRIKDRVLAVNGAFSRGDLFISLNNCSNIVECIEQQAYDKNNNPDKTSGYDHMVDAFGYMVAHELPIRKPVAHIPIMF